MHGLYFRVKLPKSFLAVNLSESHTFNIKEEGDEWGDRLPDQPSGDTRQGQVEKSDEANKDILNTESVRED